MTFSNQNRRTFLKSGATGLIAAALPAIPHYLMAAPQDLPIIGIQLYSVRAAMHTDPDGTLHKLAGMGYKNVEHADYNDRKFYGRPATEFKSLLDGMGLKMHSGHTSLTKNHWDESKKDFTDQWKQTVEDAATVGQNYVISPWMDDVYRQSYESLVKYMDVFNKCGELCKKSGLKFAYHNHNFEFKTNFNEKSIYDIILENTDKNLVAQQIDIGNMYGAGGRALDIIRKHPGRFELMHVKDMIKGEGGMDGYISTILGKGVAHTHEVVDYTKTHGVTVNFIIEQEEYQNLDPLVCAKQDLQIMKGWGFNA